MNIFLGILKTVDKLFGLAKDGKLDDLADIIEDDKKRNIAYAKGNIFKLVDSLVVEPVIIISDDLKREEDIAAVIKSNLTLFTSTYSQAMVYLTNLVDMDPRIALDLLSSTSANMDLGFAEESLEGVMSTGDNFMETLNYTEEKTRVNITKSKMNAGDNTIPALIATYELELSAKGKDGTAMTITVPITIKAKIVYGSEDEVLSMVDYNGDSKRFLSRLSDVAAGLISISELITSSDLIKEQKKRKLDNKSLFTDLMEERLRDSLSKVASSGAIGFGMYYQMVIVSDRVKQLIEARINGRIVSDRYKVKLLDQIRSMTITVYDTINNRVSIHANGLSGYSDLSIKEIKKKDKDGDVTDILKAVMASKML